MSRGPRLLSKTAIEGPARGSWNLVCFHVSGLQARTMVYLAGYDELGKPATRDLFLNEATARGGRAEMLCFLPQPCVELRLFAAGPDANSVRISSLALRPQGRLPASLRLLRNTPRAALAPLWDGPRLRPRALMREFRVLLAKHNDDLQTPPQDYATWITLFDYGVPEDFHPRPGRPSLGLLVMAWDDASPALAATLRSLEEQQEAVPHVVVSPGTGLAPAQAAARLDGDYLGILQAGEVLPPHATLVAGDQLERLGRPEIAIADEDDIAADGHRHSPRFKPEPGQVAMLSGTLSRGLWLVRRDAVAVHLPSQADCAETLRMGLWLSRYRADARPFSARIPFILSHRRFDAETASPEALAAVAASHLGQAGPAIVPLATSPLTFEIRADAPAPRVTVIVPSTLRQPHSLSCIQSILTGTDYPAMDLHVVVMQAGELDHPQQAAAETLRRHPNAVVETLAASSFNFSTANNHVAARTQGDLILLLNDDVSPTRPDWLRWMVAFTADPNIGVVGARLLYPDGKVQHGGVIMGLAGLCEHAHRFLPRNDPGYMSRAILAQELSVVTAACMLVRRDVFEQVGGLDEGYPSAFNDVDLALRIGEAGYSVIYAPQAELYHHELQTYGSHYAGEREAFQAREVARFRSRWTGVCRADPFHNPNLGLLPHHEWKLAFPPRISLDSDAAEPEVGQVGP